MASTSGRCTNVDYCSLAAARRDIQVKIGQDFVCPECAKPLRSPTMGESSGRSGVVLAGAALALSLVGGGVYAGYRLSRPASLPTALPPRASAQTAQIVPPMPAPGVKPAPAATSSAVKSEPAVLLRLAGSPSLAGLASKLAAAYLASLGDGVVTSQPGPAAGQTVVTGLRVGRPEAISIVAASSNAGFVALTRGSADIGMASSQVSAAELQQTRALGDLSAPSAEHAVALDGAAVVVNPGRALAMITLAQLRGVLDGSIANWQQLGAGIGPIDLVASSAPVGESLSALVPGAPPVPSAAPRVTDAASAVIADPNALALVPWTLTGHAKVLPVAEVGALPALPDAASIAGGGYPLARRLFFYAPAIGGSPFAQRFIAYTLSPEGQALAGELGLVPLHPATEAAPAVLTAKDRYKQLVGGATRLAADLHFEASSNKLDLHSAREVDRVWNFMMSDHTPPDHLVLLGFADNQGTPEANQALSRERAKAVAEVFAHRGLPPGQVVAFGSDLPIADNGSEAGREKNRRVEVFLKN